MNNKCLSESAVREKANRMGFRVCKSRTRNPHMNDLGDYMLIDSETYDAVLGIQFNATLEEIADYLNALTAALRQREHVG